LTCCGSLEDGPGLLTRDDQSTVFLILPLSISFSLYRTVAFKLAGNTQSRPLLVHPRKDGRLN